MTKAVEIVGIKDFRFGFATWSEIRKAEANIPNHPVAANKFFPNLADPTPTKAAPNKNSNARDDGR